MGDFTTTMQALQADITEAQCAHLFDRLMKCFEEKDAGKKRKTLQYSEVMAAVMPVITMPGFVETITDGHGIGLSVLDVHHSRKDLAFCSSLVITSDGRTLAPNA